MMGEMCARLSGWTFAALLAALVAGCVGGRHPYWAIEPIHHVRNSPIPVPRPALKPPPPRETVVVAIRPQSKPAAAPSAGARQIRVKRGDTVYGLARIHGVAVSQLVAVNDLEPPYLLRVGEELRLPAPRTHIVRRGETPFSIARRYDLDVASLIQVNRLQEPRDLRVGTTLRIPASRGEEVRVAARPSLALPEPPARTGRGFDWPVAGTIVSTFGPKDRGLRNDGLNIAAPRGAPVRAAEDGVVAYAGDGLQGFGNLLLVRHADGWVTAYAHNEEMLVRRGDRVERGQMIARVGSTGSVTSPQLHFEVRRGRQALDPTGVLPRLSARAD